MMYSGYDKPPSAAHTRLVRSPACAPAPSQTTAGNTATMHAASYRPFIHNVAGPPTRGRASAANRIAALHAKPCFTRPGRTTRDSSRPAQNGYIRRVSPSWNWTGSSDQPPITSPFGAALVHYLLLGPNGR